MTMQDSIGVPACFSTAEKLGDDHSAGVTRSGQSVYMSVYRTKVADHCRLVTITWCKNLLLHGLSISVEGPEGEAQYSCKVELKPWYFWRKQGSKRFIVDGNRAVDIFWDLKAAKFNGETEPTSEYYVAVVCDEEVVLLLGDLKKDAYRRTGCRPALIDPILVSKKEHIFGKKRFSTRAKFHEKGKWHEISIECKNRGNGNGDSVVGSVQPEMEIRIDGHLVIHVKHLQWKFRVHLEPNPNHLAKKNLFFPRAASFSAFDDVAGLEDCKTGVASLTARSVVATFIYSCNKQVTSVSHSHLPPHLSLPSFVDPSPPYPNRSQGETA